MRRTLTFTLSLTSSGLLALLLVVRLGSWMPWWWLEVLDTFALYAFAPFVGTIILACVLRSRALAAISLGAIALFAQQYGAQIVSTGRPSDSAATSVSTATPQVRVLTLNTLGASVERETLVELLQTWQPDIVMLQEMTPRFAETVQPAILDAYPHRVAVGLDDRFKGSVTWSRLPLGEAQRLDMGDSANVLHRVAISTTSGKVWLYNVHLANPTGTARYEGRLAAARQFQSGQRDRELARLVEQTARVDGPFVAAGDFNLAAGTGAYRAFPSDWHDAFAEAGRGFGHTYPAVGYDRSRWFRIPLPLIRIDYIWTSPDLRPRAAWTQAVQGSDHLAVIADLELVVSQ